MNNKLINKEKVFIFFFCIISLISIILLLNNNLYFVLYFHQNDNDSFMDLYNSVIEEKARVRGSSVNGFYPPLSLLIYRILGHGIINIDYSLPTRMQAFSLRHSVYGSFLLFLHIIPFFLFFILSIFHIVEGGNKRKYFYCILLSFSGLIWNALERGNIIIYAYLFTIMFVVLYKQENNTLILFSYICLAIAANLKFYPAIFGLLLLERRDWKGVVKCIAFFIIIYILSYILCGFNSIPINENSQIVNNSYGIFSSLKDSLKGIYININNGFTWGEKTSNSGTGLNYSIINLCRVLYLCLLKIQYPELNILDTIKIYYQDYISLYRLFCFVLFMIGIFSFFFCKEKWKKLAIPSFLCFYIPPTSWTYVLIFMFIPFLEFINSKEETIPNLIYSVIFACIFALFIIPYRVNTIPYAITGSFLIQSGVLLLMYLCLFFSAIKNLVNIIIYKFKG